MIESDPVPEIWEEDAGAYDEAREDDGWLPLFGLLREYGRYCPVKIGKEPLMRVGKQRLPELIEQDRLSGSRNSPERTGWELHITSPRLVVIDCEHPEKKGPGSLGPDGFATFEAFWKAHVDELAETLIVQSASGGLHYYFLLPWDLLASGQQLAGRIGALSGVDVITAGTKVILPGTEVDVKNGPGKYSVRQGLDVGIAEMPHPLALAFSECLVIKKPNHGKSERRRRRPERSGGRYKPQSTLVGVCPTTRNPRESLRLCFENTSTCQSCGPSMSKRRRGIKAYPDFCSTSQFS